MVRRTRRAEATEAEMAKALRVRIWQVHQLTLEEYTERREAGTLALKPQDDAIDTFAGWRFPTSYCASPPPAHGGERDG